MNNFYVVANKSKDPEMEVAYEIMNYLKSKGKCCQCQPFDEDLENTQYRYTNAEKVPAGVECIIVLGGDGTLIQAARDLKKLDLPLWGINIGTLGFLTDAEKDSMYQAMDSLMADDYVVDKRMMLEGEVYRNGECICYNTALNDIVINRSGTLRVIDFDIFVNGEYLSSYSADGVIVSTPTGSTAYSLSAGGPIVKPQAEILVITPVCPHTLNKRSIILGRDDVITIKMSDNKGLSEQRVASYDGELSCGMITGDEIVIKKAEQKISFIKTNKLSFLQLVREKLYL